MTETLERPAPRWIDALIAEYAELQAVALEASTVAKAKAASADQIKARLVTLVETFGDQHTEKSKRLKGVRHSATTTTATRVSVDDTAVDTFRQYLAQSAQPELAPMFFTERTTYQLVGSPDKVLAGLSIGGRIRTKIVSLLQACFQVRTSAPSLKVDVGA